ncbi:MAG: zinc ribbon domain-containing protein [Candidatus Manganitrophaceae bacterium]|nr:MAG: zinc ribbon domain-containing protein [Candidatus Manganitrophaceae bacterium]
MPIYEYECEKCKKQFEVLQKLSDPPIASCSSCGGNVHKIISSPSGLLFKGSGWYVTDYARKGAKKGDASPSSKGEGKSASSEKGEAAPKETPSKPPSTE